MIRPRLDGVPLGNSSFPGFPMRSRLFGPARCIVVTVPYLASPSTLAKSKVSQSILQFCVRSCELAEVTLTAYTSILV